MKTRILIFPIYMFFLGIFPLTSFAGSDTWRSTLKQKQGSISVWYYNSDNFISDASGRLSGIEYELLNGFADYLKKKHHIDLKIKFIKAPTFTDLYKTVKNGGAGIFGACSFSITQARRSEVNFTPPYLPDVEVLISSADLPVVTDTAEFIRVFSKALGLSVPNTTFEENILKLQKAFPKIRYRNETYASNIRERIGNEHGLFSYIELPTYFASIKEGVKLKRQPLFKVERTGYGIIYPKSSDWALPLQEFFSDTGFVPFINNLIHKYFGEDVQDLLWSSASKNSSLATKEIAMLTKEREIQSLELSRQELELRNKNIVVAAIASVMALLLILGYFILRGFNQKKKANLLLNTQKAEIEKINLELNNVLNHLSEKNKDITDSINYAVRIQQALLPDPNKLNNIFQDSFILFKPRDIVSGDFYFIEPIAKQGKSLYCFAVGDCTGHGVPGAFMSIIGTNFLNHALTDSSIETPAAALEFVSSRINHVLHKDHSVDIIRDGMDIAFCVLDPETLELHFSGANNPALIFNQESLVELKGIKRPVGYSEVEIPFLNHSVKLKKGDSVYLFSDGYADQFGGPSGKKFKYSKLKEMLSTIQHLSMREQKDFIQSKFEDWKGELAQVDDVCIIGVRV